MRVNENYFVRWKYLEDGLTTECHIHDNTTMDVYKSSAKRYIHDAPDKEKARKASLANTLQILPRNIRSQFWESFRNMKNEPKW